MIYTKQTATLLLTCLLTSCGGGGDESAGTGLSISGTIIAAANTIADLDTQDINAPHINNSLPANAQNLSNPGTAGGNVNFSQQDSSDYYRVFLNAGDTATLQIADVLPTAFILNNDLRLNLFIFDNAVGDYVFVLASNNPSQPQLEQLTAPQSGDYLVQVEAHSGSSNYILSIGQNSNPTPAFLTDDIVPGEILVKFKEISAAVQLQSSLPSSVQITSTDNISTHTLLLNIQPKTTVSAVHTTPSKMTTAATLAIIRRLNQRPDVLYAEPNYLHWPLVVNTPNDPFFPSQWNLTNINLPQGWKQVTAGQPVTVAVLDSGIRFNHPDLSQRFIADSSYSTGNVGYDFIDVSESLDGDGPDDDPTDPGNPALTGSIFHGTLVAGIIAANTHNNTGIAGIANTADVQLLPLRILSDSGGRSSDICKAIFFAARLGNAGDKTLTTPVDVINMSFGSTAFSQTVQDCVTQARAQGVILVAAAGNDASSTPTYPAAYDGVLSVSATTLDKKRAFYSNTGDTIDIAAPGGDISQDIDADGNPDGIITTSATDNFGNLSFGYRYTTGTSMSAPHVAGVVALMKSIYPGLTPSVLDQWLAAGFLTENISPQLSTPNPQFGHGLIDARAALTQAQTAAGGTVIAIPPLLIATPRSLNFGATIDSMNLTLNNGGANTLLVSNPPLIAYAQGNNWITLANNIDANGLGVYTVTVDRGAHIPGNYAATLTISSNANTLTIPVRMNIPAVDIHADTGYTYILLTDPADNRVIRSQAVSAVNGIYTFDFKNILPGEYQIYVGTDMDMDELICDPGESCGAYATLDRLLNIAVTDKSIDNIKIRSGFLLDQGNLSFSMPKSSRLSIPRPTLP